MTEYNPGGDMTEGVTRAHVETPEEIAANPIEGNVPGQIVPSTPPVGPSYTTQHAKVLRFEVSIGKDDDARTIEQFEQDIRLLLLHGSDLVLGEGKLPPHNITLTGGYYIIDGKVCMPADYDAATKNRIPGTQPPSWAGGPVAKDIPPYAGMYSTPTPTPVASGPVTKVTDPSDKAQTVQELAEGIKNTLSGGSA